MPGNVIIIIAVIGVIVIRRFSPIVGGGLGMAVAIGITAWGVITFGKGDGMALLGFPLHLPIFLVLVGGWFLVEAYGTVRAIRKRTKKESAG